MGAFSLLSSAMQWALSSNLKRGTTPTYFNLFAPIRLLSLALAKEGPRLSFFYFYPFINVPVPLPLRQAF